MPFPLRNTAYYLETAKGKYISFKIRVESNFDYISGKIRDTSNFGKQYEGTQIRSETKLGNQYISSANSTRIEKAKSETIAEIVYKMKFRTINEWRRTYGIS